MGEVQQQPQTEAEARIRKTLTGYAEHEVDSILAVERGFAAHLAGGGNDTEEARAYFTRGSDPHWRWAWEWARGDNTKAA